MGNHTQLDGGAIVSTAGEDKSSLSTQSFGYTNIENKASYSGDAIGFGASGGVGNSSPGGVNWNTPLAQSGPTGPGPVTSNGLAPSGFSAAGTGSEASGTTYATVGPGKITVRVDADTGHDSTAGLNRDPAIANGAVRNTFDAQQVQNDLAVQQAVGQVGMQVIGEAANYLREQALEAKAEAERAYDSAALAQDEAGMAKAKADLSAADQKAGFWSNDGPGRIGAHSIVSGAAAALGGGNVAGAVVGTMAGDYVGASAGQWADDTLGGTLLANVAVGAAGAATGGTIGGGAGAISGAGGALSADLYNRQLHLDDNPHRDERTLAKRLAEKSGGKYTQEQIEDQMRIMGVSVDGKHASGAPETLIGEMPTDPGVRWVSAGTTADGRPVLTQVTAQADPELQSYILANANSASPGQVPSVYQYDRPSNNDWGFSVTRPTGPFTQFNRNDVEFMRNTTADTASMVSTNAGRFGAAAATGAAIPSPYAPGLAAAAYGATVVGVAANAITQMMRPDIGQYWVASSAGIAANAAAEKYPLLSPAINETANKLNDSGLAKSIQNTINSYWRGVMDSVNRGENGKN